MYDWVGDIYTDRRVEMLRDGELGPVLEVDLISWKLYIQG